jgi:hypothetical protein
LANVRASISRHQGVQGGTLASQPQGVVRQGIRRIKKRLTTAETAAAHPAGSQKMASLLAEEDGIVA